MIRKGRFAVVALAAATVVAFAAAPVAAETYTVAMKNGTTFTSRYQPQDASWDPAQIVLLTEWGNEIALAKADIDAVTAESESRGFGHVINTTTLAIGWAPNDALDPNSEEGKAAAADARAEAAAAGSAPTVYNQQQFVEPGQASGLPVNSPVLNTNYIPSVGEPASTTPPPTPPNQ